jgi:site-specific DNA recombinase
LDIAAAEIETAVLAALKTRQRDGNPDGGTASIEELERVVIARDRLLIRTRGTVEGDDMGQEIRVAWAIRTKDTAIASEGGSASEVSHNVGLIQSIVRAQAWVNCLRDGAYDSIEQLAEANRLHPKVVRQALRLAFLSPELTSAVLEGRQSQGT